MSQFLKQNLDIYGKRINLHLHGEEKYKTKIGAMMSLLAILTIATITLFFLMDLFNRNVMTIIFNQDETTIPFVNLTNMPIMFTIADARGTLIKPERLYTFDLKKVELIADRTNSTQAEIRQELTQLGVEPCDKEKHIPKEYYKFFEVIKMDYYYCFANMSDLILYGKFGDYYTGYSSLQLYLNRCENSTLNKNNCHENTYIDKTLTNVYINFAFLTYQIDHYNSTQSRKMKLQTISSKITTTLLKRYQYYFNQVIYNTDYGFVFNDDVKENFFTYDTFELDMDTKNSGAVSSTSNFVNFSFRCSEHVFLYKRSYIKLQTFLANVGGFSKAVMVIGKIFVTLITRKFYILDISNSIFNFKNENNSSDVEEVEKNEKNNLNINMKNLSNHINKIPLPALSIPKPIPADKVKKKKLIIVNSLNNNDNSQEPFENHNFKKSLQAQAHMQPYKNNNKISNINEKLKISMSELIFPQFCFRKNKINEKLEQCKNFIIKNISVEYMIEKFYELNIVVKQTLSESQLNEIKQRKKFLFRTFLYNSYEIENENEPNVSNIKNCKHNNDVNLKNENNCNNNNFKKSNRHLNNHHFININNLKSFVDENKE